MGRFAGKFGGRGRRTFLELKSNYFYFEIFFAVLFLFRYNFVGYPVLVSEDSKVPLLLETDLY